MGLGFRVIGLRLRGLGTIGLGKGLRVNRPV